ncbi:MULTISPECIES: phage baseplate assembly protein V [unclassified Pseudomonas]|uniref:phage baseplate assembly protein V n=1 Tax=unclassified Pseudomonas TaxID=196821 RepID=UPI000C86C7BC|nr:MULTISPECIES: phage baseplate assembly protein V [unclassified Pseudomonas]PMU25094.1 phage baseplate assembly protein V [Pseudomonas sp. GP01-A9]PMU30272.1 phage baseplate assembly protein V [Pseudomonas sp. GP01-A13]PMU42183.1 phage baseplate assembly protein V [Pseudomonas sp. GP01-A8]PMU50680.1 phage baseplate assembly protein V [Pseudomonas sp. GP01-A14]PMU55327.1 phage baseplate assembly protein V [Pseudomonas sp. GP01-A6]
MNDFAAFARMLENLIRFGVIDAVQMEPPRVKVKTGELTTAWLPWIVQRAGADQVWDPPTMGEQVMLFSPSGQLANGVVVTGLFSDHIPANGNRPGLHRRTYADGTVIEYDSVAHHLNATLANGGTTNLVSTGGINLVGDITHQGDYIQTGNQNVTGTVTVITDVIAAGISLVNHPHGGVMPGNGKTGKPE